MKDFVRESQILSRTDLILPGGRKCREFEIAGGESFETGQYLMIRAKKREVDWPYPYFIHRRTAHGLIVLAREDQELYHGSPKDSLQYWGPRGTSPVRGGEEAVLVVEPAVYFAVYPFICKNTYKRLIIMGQKYSDSFIYPDSSEYCGEIHEAAKLLSVECGPVIAAFNSVLAKAFAESLEEERKKDTYIFVSNKKACGIDGCKGCYLHGGHTGFGINVCCKGPFMPLHVIDFEADGQCFETFL